ncbi:MAG: cytochrome C oxidase subunit IV family protein [Verrucomicrobiales bacterium]|nr:cytochrome C oxidase subunit IV family protein [Verrucomicrobiales bacterium]
MAEETHDWDKHKKTYWAVGIALFVFTGVTLALGLVPILDLGPPGPTPADFVIGLAVAGTKATLVSLIFMHLNHEKGLIYKTLLFTFLFFVGLMALTLFAGADPIIEQYDTRETTNGKLVEKP